MKQKLIDFYLVYVNDYLTIATMAEHYNIEENECRSLIELGKKYHEEIVERLKQTEERIKELIDKH